MVFTPKIISLYVGQCEQMRHESNGIIKACYARGRKDVVATDDDDVSVLFLTPAHPEKSSDGFFELTQLCCSL